MKIMILLLIGFLLVGCRGPQTSESQRQPVAETDVNSPSKMTIKYETLLETLARLEAESKTSKVMTNGPIIKEWYGETLGDLGIVRNVTVQHIGTGAGNSNLEVTKKHILTALTAYKLVDYEKFRSSTHIPLGTPVKIEYKNGIVGWVTLFTGVPYTVSLMKDNITGEYGLRKISEQKNAPDKK